MHVSDDPHVLRRYQLPAPPDVARHVDAMRCHKAPPTRTCTPTAPSCCCCWPSSKQPACSTKQSTDIPPLRPLLRGRFGCSSGADTGQHPGPEEQVDEEGEQRPPEGGWQSSHRGQAIQGRRNPAHANSGVPRPACPRGPLTGVQLCALASDVLLSFFPMTRGYIRARRSVGRMAARR